MFVVETKVLAVVMCVVTMLCWGSWANMQKLASKEWRFQLFYWDYSFGVLLLTLAFALTLGNMGAGGRGFLDDLGQASGKYIGYALLGGVVFNIANILLVAAIDIAGMAVAFPVGIGLALVKDLVKRVPPSELDAGGKKAVDSLKAVADKAAAVIAIGSCASWGGIPSADPNPTDAVGVDALIKNKPIVNIPGCPPRPEALRYGIIQLQEKIKKEHYIRKEKV